MVSVPALTPNVGGTQEICSMPIASLWETDWEPDWETERTQ